jgi:hypothetical protein
MIGNKKFKQDVTAFYCISTLKVENLDYEIKTAFHYYAKILCITIKLLF